MDKQESWLRGEGMRIIMESIFIHDEFGYGKEMRLGQGKDL